MNVNVVNIQVNVFRGYVNLFHMDTLLARLRNAAPALTLFGFLMAIDLVFCLGGLVMDRRVITGAPAWLKPAKFALSTLIVSWSFACCIASITIWRRFARALDLLLAVALLLEIVLIDMQAARGTTSHFNNSTRFDATVYAVMGVSIGCIWLTMLVLTIVLFRQPFAGSAWGWSLRLGMVLALFGTGSGALMTLPNSRQLAEAHVTGKMPIAGAHTVGAADGGRGLPVTGWSIDHGDLRIAHFLGMHGLQVLPLLAWWVGRKQLPPGTQRHLIFALAASYLALFSLLLWQAFRGQSIAQPDRFTLESFALWLMLTAAALVIFKRKEGFR